MPFYNPSAWKDSQKNDPNPKRCFTKLQLGTRPGKKGKKLKILRRYLQAASISDSGILIHRRSNPYGRDFELIIVPDSITAGLIPALHLRLGHPNKTQLKTLWDRYFYAIHSEK